MFACLCISVYTCPFSLFSLTIGKKKKKKGGTPISNTKHNPPKTYHIHIPYGGGKKWTAGYITLNIGQSPHIILLVPLTTLHKKRGSHIGRYPSILGANTTIDTESTSTYICIYPYTYIYTLLPAHLYIFPSYVVSSPLN